MNMEILKDLYNHLTNLDNIFIVIIIGVVSIFIHALPELLNYLKNR